MRKGKYGKVYKVRYDIVWYGMVCGIVNVMVRFAKIYYSNTIFEYLVQLIWQGFMCYGWLCYL